MSTTTVSPLRQRMVEDMSLRNLAPRTQEAKGGYVPDEYSQRVPPPY